MCFGQQYDLVPYRKNSLYVKVHRRAHELCSVGTASLRLCICVDSWYYYYCFIWVCIQYFYFGGGTVAGPAAMYNLCLVLKLCSKNYVVCIMLT